MRHAFMIGLLIVLGAPSLRGEEIDYTIAGAGTGTLGGVSFTDAQFAITMTADTEVGSSSTGAWIIFRAPLNAATIEVDGFPLANISLGSPLFVFVNQGSQIAGLNRFVGGDLITLTDPSFATYDLDTSIGPIFDAEPESIPQFSNLATDLGPLTMTHAVDALFEAFLGGIGDGSGEFLRGDGNGDGAVNIADAVAILSSLFGAAASPLLCQDAGDVNDDGSPDVADAVFLLAAIFDGDAPTVPEPRTACGDDPTDADLLDCAESPCMP